jgi:hypothetical protein
MCDAKCLELCGSARLQHTHGDTKLACLTGVIRGAMEGRMDHMHSGKETA